MTTTARKHGPAFDPELAAAIGARVWARRRALGMSQDTLAGSAGYARLANISLIERGLVLPGLAYVPALCRALRWTPDDLFGWEDRP